MVHNQYSEMKAWAGEMAHGGKALDAQAWQHNSEFLGPT